MKDVHIPLEPATQSGERLPGVAGEKTEAVNKARLYGFPRTIHHSLHHSFVCYTDEQHGRSLAPVVLAVQRFSL